jgi:hypothetical protein
MSQNCSRTKRFVPELSLVHMLEQFHDFLTEIYELEYFCRLLGTEGIVTTKYHFEFAGEGIEYSWDCT